MVIWKELVGGFAMERMGNVVGEVGQWVLNRVICMGAYEG